MPPEILRLKFFQKSDSLLIINGTNAANVGSVMTIIEKSLFLLL